MEEYGIDSGLRTEVEMKFDAREKIYKCTYF